MRARKLSREMLNFWRKRDRELADGKRKRGKELPHQYNCFTEVFQIPELIKDLN